jgi:hypothetical protein
MKEKLYQILEVFILLGKYLIITNFYQSWDIQEFVNSSGII